MILDLYSENKKHIDFYWRINRNKTVLDRITNVLTKIFGFSFSGAKETKMQQIAESLKYNAITQTLSAVGGDTYKSETRQLGEGFLRERHLVGEHYLSILASGDDHGGFCAGIYGERPHGGKGVPAEVAWVECMSV